MPATANSTKFHFLVAFGQLVSLLLGIISGALVVTVGVAWWMGDSTEVLQGFLRTLGMTAGLSAAIFAVCRKVVGKQRLEPTARDAFASVGVGWLAVSAITALSFCWTLHIPWTDAFFETSSGLTTTGATILGKAEYYERGDISQVVDIEDVNSNFSEPGEVVLVSKCPEEGGMASSPVGRPASYGVLFWRAMLNWLGGVGIVFFVLLLLPMLRLGQSKLLYNAEVPGLKTTADQTTPHLATSVVCVLMVYIGLTLAAGICYRVTGMTTFDAVCHSFSTISTGGFSPRVDGLAAYNHLPVLQWLVILFMFLSACNFSLHIQRFSSLRRVYWRDEEFRVFFVVTLVAIGLVALMLWAHGVSREALFLGGVGAAACSLEEYLRVAAFQVVTVLSTTGFCNGNWESWGISCVLIVIALLMIPCGCGGSTAGGMKWSRIVVTCKQLVLEVRRCIAPRMVQDVRLNNERLEGELVGKTLAFVLIYCAITFAVALLLSIIEPLANDVGTALGAALTSLSNVGPGFGAVNPAGNFAEFNAASKILLAVTMIVGRLELFTILVLLLPSTWKR